MSCSHVTERSQRSCILYIPVHCILAHPALLQTFTTHSVFSRTLYSCRSLLHTRYSHARCNPDNFWLTLVSASCSNHCSPGVTAKLLSHVSNNLAKKLSGAQTLFEFRSWTTPRSLTTEVRDRPYIGIRSLHKVQEYISTLLGNVLIVEQLLDLFTIAEFSLLFEMLGNASIEWEWYRPSRVLSHNKKIEFVAASKTPPSGSISVFGRSGSTRNLDNATSWNDADRIVGFSAKWRVEAEMHRSGVNHGPA